MNTSILATEAILQTLQVSIKALTVKGKQLTLSVFRQFPVEDAYEVDGGLRQGVAYWGLVRYKIKDQASEWFVLEIEGSLYRASAEKPYEEVHSTRKLIREMENSIFVVLNTMKELGTTQPTGGDDNIPAHINIPRWDNGWMSIKSDITRLYGKDLGYQWRDVLPNTLCTDTFADAGERIDQWRSDLKMDEQKLESWRSLLLLPQLFIAV
jgi:hypothetical protein